LIIHAGDIGKPEVLALLKFNSAGPGDPGKQRSRRMGKKKSPTFMQLQVNNACLIIIHNVNDLACDPAAQGFHAVHHQRHSHKPQFLRIAME
jgi:hypothetical protein